MVTMAKKSRKNIARYEKNQSGCIKSLINNILDFRQGHTSQKLLQDKKHVSKRTAGAAHPNIKLETLSESCENCTEFSEAVQSETSTLDAVRMRVKELMREEMIGEPDRKRNGSNAIRDAEQIAAGHGTWAYVQKTRRRTRSMTSLNLRADDFAAAEGSVTEKRSHRRHKSLSSVYLNVMVEELCSQIDHKDGGVATKLIEDPSVIEDKLWDATKVLINQFSDGKGVSKDGKIQASKELMDALRIIDSNKEVFLKLLQDPNSQLVKHLQSLQDVQVEEGKFKVVTDSNLLEQSVSNGKQQSFFWRRFKGLERSSSKKNDGAEDLNKIIVLKPGPPASGNLETASPCASLPECPRSMGEKHQIDTASSAFSFAEFKRKLKQVLRKEQHGAVQNGISLLPADEQQPNLAKLEKRVSGETVAMASPSRDHFFIERIPKSLAGVKKVEKNGKLKDGALRLEKDTTISTDQRVSAIYVEAKKHLAEIIGDNNVDIDRRQVPRSLGRLMSFSGYSSPTLCSSRMEGEMRISQRGCEIDEKTSQVRQENNVTLQVPEQESEREPCIAADRPICETESSPVESISDGFPCESSVEKPINGPEVTSEVDGDIVRSLDVDSRAENSQMESSDGPCFLEPIDASEQVHSPLTSNCSEENWHSAGLGQDSCTESEPSSSQIASTLSCSATEKIEDRELMSDATSKPSPVSVLEPLFTEDNISPSGIKSFSAAEPFQPQQILFEEEIAATSEQYSCDRTGILEDDKYTFEFVKAVVQMSGLTWDELHKRTLYSDHLIDPALLDDVDFLPDLLPCDFNLLFDLINEVLIEISWLNFGCMIPFTKPFVQSKLKDKDIFTEICKRVNWYLKLDGPPRTLDQIVMKDLAKSGIWMNLHPDTETIGVQLQEAILEELMEDTILSCVSLG